MAGGRPSRIAIRHAAPGQGITPPPASVAIPRGSADGGETQQEVG